METLENRTEIGSRINELIFILGLNQSTFAKKIGTTQSTVRNIAKQISKPRYEFLESVIEAFPGLSKDWLMSGTGEAFPEGVPKTPTSSTKPKADDYLMEQLSALEKSWKENIEESKRLAAKNEKIITQQNFMIETLMSQLNTALGKLNLSEEILPESETIVLPFPNMKIVANNTLHTASLTVGK